MKVLVCGGREFYDVAYVFDALDVLDRQHNITHIIHGGAKGADELGAEWAKRRGAQEVCCPANWHRFGKSAGPLRNAAMLEMKPDLVVAFPGGYGTADMVKKAGMAAVKVIDMRKWIGERTADQAEPRHE